MKKPRFPSILGPQRRPSRVESAPGECRPRAPTPLINYHSGSVGLTSRTFPVPLLTSGQNHRGSPPASEAAVPALPGSRRAHGVGAPQGQPVQRGLGTHAHGLRQRLVAERRRLQPGQQPGRGLRWGTFLFSLLETCCNHTHVFGVKGFDRGSDPSGGTPNSAPSRLSDGLQSDPLDGLPYPATLFDPLSLDQLQEDDRESDRYPPEIPHRVLLRCLLDPALMFCASSP